MLLNTQTFDILMKTNQNLRSIVLSLSSFKEMVRIFLVIITAPRPKIAVNHNHIESDYKSLKFYKRKLTTIKLIKYDEDSINNIYDRQYFIHLIKILLKYCARLNRFYVANLQSIASLLNNDNNIIFDFGSVTIPKKLFLPFDRLKHLEIRCRTSECLTRHLERIMFEPRVDGSIANISKL